MMIPSPGMFANAAVHGLEPTIQAMCSWVTAADDDILTIKLIKETHGYGRSHQYWALINGQRLRPGDDVETDGVKARQWYNDLVALYRTARSGR